MREKVIFFVLLAVFTILFLDIVSVVGLFKGIYLSEKNHLKNIFVAYIALYCFLVFLSSLLKEKIFKIVVTILTIPVAFLNGAIIWYMLYYDGLPSSHDISTILSTNYKETQDFIQTIFGYEIFLAIIISLIPFVIIYFMKPVKIKNKIVVSVMIVASIVIVAFTYNKRWIKREIAILDIHIVYEETKKAQDEFFALLNEIDKKEVFYENIKNSFTENSKQTFVLVISESQSIYHFSIYGYEKETTPFLKSIKDDLFIFNNVYSPALYTNSSLEKIITFADNYNNMTGYDAGNIIRFFKDAGFKTYWLSNQYYLGEYDSQYSAIAYRADKAVFLNQVTGEFLEADKYDTDLLPYFEEIVKDNNVDKKFIVLHLFGSHQPFSMRYPSDFGSFDYSISINDLLGRTSKEKYVATYDNSVEFTDYFMKKLIEIMEKDNSQSYVMFMSDHGQDVYDADETMIVPRSHNSATVPSYYFIPFFLWFNDEYKKSYPEVIERVKKSLDKKYQTDRVIHTIIDLSRLNHNKYIDGDNIISDNFIEKKRILHGIEVE